VTKADTAGRVESGVIAPQRLACLVALEKKILWLSAWIIHNANHLRESRDGLKVGGHQASCASMVTLMTALYLDVLRPQDRVAVKPHASPVFHAIQYLLGQQTRDKLERFRAFGGAQSYPSRTKDTDDVDFSTGSVGLGVAMTSFASLVQDYVRLKSWAPVNLPGDLPVNLPGDLPVNLPGDLPGGLAEGRMIALMGDAELDEGNVFEAMLEGWKHDLRNVWWVIDYNRQSLDAVITDQLFGRFDDLFRNMGWNVVTLKYGTLLQAAFRRRGGAALRQWIDDCPNSLYSALVFQGGAAWRRHLLADIGAVAGVGALLAAYDDAALARLMTNLGGHDMVSVLEAFHDAPAAGPTCFIAYTIKGFGLPFAGHKDNHAGLMNPDQMAHFQRTNAIAAGEEWAPFAGLDLPAAELQAFLDQIPFAQAGARRLTAPYVAVPDSMPAPEGTRRSTQEAFGKRLGDLAREESELVERIVTTSPDVTVSTNLGGWVNRRGIFDRHPRADVFKEEKVVSAQRWAMSPEGQHIELGIAENNLFTLLGALGLSHALFGVRLLPIGTLYDPFIQRGLDALNYACYQDARFIVVATPSGVTLGPEGGAHQSVATPLIGLAQDGIAAFEPAFADELAVILAWSFDYLQRDGRDGAGPNKESGEEGGWLRDHNGGSVYLRLSTRGVDQPQRRLDAALREQIILGGYWLRPPGPGGELAIVTTGALATEALAAHDAIREEIPGAGLLAVTSADRLNAGWHAAQRGRQSGEGRVKGRGHEAGRARGAAHVERLLMDLAPDAALVTLVDGHPATLSWLGGVRGQRVQALGVEHFGQSGDLPDLYRHYRLDLDAVIEACAAACLGRKGL
jgi:pyruvate dehydrogenase E1 component